jgi:hypothetical protein
VGPRAGPGRTATWPPSRSCPSSRSPCVRRRSEKNAPSTLVTPVSGLAWDIPQVSGVTLQQTNRTVSAWASPHGGPRVGAGKTCEVAAGAITSPSGSITSRSWFIHLGQRWGSGGRSRVSTQETRMSGFVGRTLASRTIGLNAAKRLGSALGCADHRCDLRPRVGGGWAVVVSPSLAGLGSLSGRCARIMRFKIDNRLVTRILRRGEDEGRKQGFWVGLGAQRECCWLPACAC